MTWVTRVISLGVVGGSIVGAPPEPAAAQQPLNLGFERLGVAGGQSPWGWSPAAFAPGAASHLDSLVARTGRRSLRITLPPGDTTATQGLSYWISPRFAWGQRVTVSGWIRSDDLKGTGRIAAWALGAGDVLAADSVEIRAPTSGRWVRRSVEIPVDSSAHSLVISVTGQGEGTRWFDDLSVEIDGERFDQVPVGRAPTAVELASLSARSSPLRVVDASGDLGVPGRFADLEALGRIVGNARIVALGESTHGTSEFFRLKRRVTEYLVRERGFRVFAIEANQLAVEYINAYVHGADDDPRRVISLMFAVWNTEEMLDFVEWMRQYNAAHPGATVEFVGYDMQDPSLPIDSVRAFLSVRDGSLARLADSLYRDYREAWRVTAYPQAADSVRRGWLDRAETMWRRIADRQADWLRQAQTRDDSVAVEWVVQNANVVRQAARSAWTGDLADRDSAMAENIRWMLQQRPPGTRAVLWAHNGHVGRGSEPGRGFFLGQSMGVHLARRYGDDLRVFGLLTYDGEYSGTRGLASREYVAAEAYPAPVGSVSEVLHRISLRQPGVGLIADLRGADEDPAGHWLEEPRPMRFVGYAAVDFGFEAVIAAAHVFDAILFVDHTSASRLLR